MTGMPRKRHHLHRARGSVAWIASAVALLAGALLAACFVGAEQNGTATSCDHQPRDAGGGCTNATAVLDRNNATTLGGVGTVRSACGAGKGKRVCIFDFDYTLKHGCCYHCCGVMPAQAASAVGACLDEGYDIAIASANTHWTFVRNFLKQEYPAFKSLVYTEAVQTGQSYKTSELERILRHYDMASTPACAVFFDDLWSNKQYADSVGVPFVKVDPGVGVTTNDVRAGMQRVEEACDAARRAQCQMSSP